MAGVKAVLEVARQTHGRLPGGCIILEYLADIVAVWLMTMDMKKIAGHAA